MFFWITRQERVEEFPCVLDQDILDRVLESMLMLQNQAALLSEPMSQDIQKWAKLALRKKSSTELIPNMSIVPLLQALLLSKMLLWYRCHNRRTGIWLFSRTRESSQWRKLHRRCFREIAKRSFEYLGIPPDDPYGYPYGDPRRDPEKEVWMTETKTLKEIYNKWNKK